MAKNILLGRDVDNKKSLQKEGEYEKEKVSTNILREKVEQAKYQVSSAEAEEALIKIQKKITGLFAEPKPEMTLVEKLRERVRKRQEFSQAVKELTEGLPPEEKAIIEAEAYKYYMEEIK